MESAERQAYKVNTINNFFTVHIRYISSFAIPANTSRRRFAISTYRIRSSIDVLFIAPRNAKLMGLFNKIRARNRSHFMAAPFRMGADNDVEWVRKVSRASGDLVNVLMKEKERQPPGRVQETWMHAEAASFV